MELREAYEKADADGGGSLNEEEFIDAFKEIIGKGMNDKQLRQLFMRIDADSNSTVEWHEFMNYMLLENQTLSSMKQEHSEYVKSVKPDPAPHMSKLCHEDMITDIIIIPPEVSDEELEQMKPDQVKRKMKYATAGRDGKVKIWNGLTLHNELTIQVTKQTSKDKTKTIWVTCICYMKLSRRLVAASANRMISFYDLNENKNKSPDKIFPTSRIEGLVGIPLCLEYHQYKKDSSDKLETLLVGDDLGICHKYDIIEENWHTCEYKQGSSDPNKCHAKDIIQEYEKNIEDAFKKKEKGLGGDGK